MCPAPQFTSKKGDLLLGTLLALLASESSVEDGVGEGDMGVTGGLLPASVTVLLLLMAPRLASVRPVGYSEY